MRRGSGALGNGRLTSLVGLVLLVLLAVEGATIPWIQPLLSVHVFVGMLLLGPGRAQARRDRLPLCPLLHGRPRVRAGGAARPAHARARRAGARPLDANAVRNRRRAARRAARGRRWWACTRRASSSGSARWRSTCSPMRFARHTSAAGLLGTPPPRPGTEDRGLRCSQSRPASGIAVATYPLARPWFHPHSSVRGEAAASRGRRAYDGVVRHRAREAADRPAPGVALRLPPVHPGPLPGYLLIADRNNNRALVVSPNGKVVWADYGAPRPRRRVLHARAGTRSSRTRSSTTR